MTDDAKPFDLCLPDKITAGGTMTTISTTRIMSDNIIQNRRERCFCRWAARRGASMVEDVAAALVERVSTLRGNVHGNLLLKRTHCKPQYLLSRVRAQGNPQQTLQPQARYCHPVPGSTSLRRSFGLFQGHAISGAASRWPIVREARM